MKIALLILAAGNSSRMKTAKQLLPVGDKTLLGLTIENALKTHVEDIFCVLGANSTEIRSNIKDYNIDIIENLNYTEGVSSSISCAIKYLEKSSFDAALIMLGDQPNIKADYLNALILNFKKKPDHIFASKYSKKNGVPAIFPLKYFPDLRKLQGEKGASDLLNNDVLDVKTIDMKVDLTDIDTPEDYKNFIK
ncbi:nucleotidyltransferase family protein [Halpernia frigidisoli]|uniref:Molybdenum cofactor cytidylyltransferase n=1 Tax=Halpernia frigidisoli TaxID=1125876 RepID=A0A1I3D4P0_9FLAO|nr:nucleotidyltransferase family protein [Halpernia frigidisoli]SFH81646.1 molybdenum cofactor cytidylyltransferase [Halpernia frigidisoli]